MPTRRFSKEGNEVEHPEKPEKGQNHHSNEGVQSVRTDQNSRNGCLCNGSRSPSMNYLVEVDASPGFLCPPAPAGKRPRPPSRARVSSGRFGVGMSPSR